MAEIKFHRDDEETVSNEVEAVLEIGQGRETFSISGYGMNKQDAVENAVDALNKFITRAEIEAKEAIALIEMETS